MFAIIDDGKVIAVDVDNKIFDRAIVVPDDTVYGDSYVDGYIVKTGVREPSNEYSNQELREIAYQTMIYKLNSNEALIDWYGYKTVDDLNRLYMVYLAEGDAETCNTLQGIIKNAKQYIRSVYPDNE